MLHLRLINHNSEITLSDGRRYANMKELCQALRSKPGTYKAVNGQEIIVDTYGYQLPVPLAIPDGAGMDEAKIKSLNHMIDSSQLIFKDGSFQNTGRFEGTVNNSSGLYWTNKDADKIADWANEMEIKLITKFE